MENPLSGLISGTAKRPVIINGRLLMDKGSIVTVKRDRYQVEFTKMSANRQESVIENGDELLNEMADSFNAKYGQIVSNNPEAMGTFMANVDTFTGAIVMRNAVYDALLDEAGEQHFHDGTFQFSPSVKAILDSFLVDSVVDYFNIYSRIMNRRLMASYMPVVVKGHLVAGLFQPMVVQTRLIRSPLRFGDFDWFFTYLNSPDTLEEYLEHQFDTSRNLELTVTAMCDLSAKFNIPCVKELNRLQWMCILLSILLGMHIPSGLGFMMGRYKSIWDPIDIGRGKNGQVKELAGSLYNSLNAIRNTLAIR